MDHDAAHKYIYGLPEVTADLLRLIAPDWVDELDLATLEDRSSEYLDAAHRKRVGDLVWRVCFGKGRAPGGGRPVLLVLVEFQSKVDWGMAERVREYAKMLLERAGGGRRAGREGARPWVLPIVVYNGSRPWTAAGRATDLAALPSSAALRGLALHQPQSYLVLAAGGGLTAGARPAQDWPLENRVSATVRLQAAATPQDLPPRLLEEFARFPGAGNEAFRRALHSWARALWMDKTGGAADFPAFGELERTKGAIMTTVAEAAWDRWEAKVMAKGIEQGIERGVQQGIERGVRQGIERGVRQGIERGVRQGIERGVQQGIERGVRQGIAQGRAEGGAQIISRLAALRFGAATAKRLDGLLKGRTTPQDLDALSAWMLECDDGGELLSRVSSLLADRQG